MKKNGIVIIYVIFFIISFSFIINFILNSVKNLNINTTVSLYKEKLKNIEINNKKLLILALEGQDFKNNCINTFIYKDTFFEVENNITYFLTNCSSTNCASCYNLNNKEQNGTIIINGKITTKVPFIKINKNVFFSTRL